MKRYRNSKLALAAIIVMVLSFTLFGCNNTPSNEADDTQDTQQAAHTMTSCTGIVSSLDTESHFVEVETDNFQSTMDVDTSKVSKVGFNAGTLPQDYLDWLYENLTEGDEVKVGYYSAADPSEGTRIQAQEIIPLAHEDEAVEKLDAIYSATIETLNNSDQEGNNAAN